MTRFLLRILGLWILAAGFFFAIYDGTKSIAAGEIVLTPLSKTWNDIQSTSLQTFQEWVIADWAPWAWQLIFQPILEQPSWLVFGALGAILILLGRKKKPIIGFAR